MSDEKNNPKTPLTQFIDENSKLFSTLAVFVALSVFANNFPDKETGRFLSFLLLSLSLFVFLEIVRNFRWFDDSAMVRSFGELFSLCMLVFVYLWIKSYHLYLLGFLAMALVVLFMLLATALCGALIRRILRLAWFKGINERARELFIPLFGTMCLMALALAALQHFRR